MLKYNKNVLFMLLVASFCLIGCGSKEKISTEQQEASVESNVTESTEEIVEAVVEENGDVPQDTVIPNDNQEIEEALGKDDAEAQTTPVVNQDKIEAVTVDLTETNYSYFLSDFEPYYDRESAKTLMGLKSIFGFNVPEGYFESGYRSSSPQDNPELCANTGLQFDNPNDVGRIIVGIPEDTSYLEEFILNDMYSEGISIHDFNMNMDWFSTSLCSMEKSEEIETPYGTARIIYQTVMVNDERMLNQEIVLFGVNDYKVAVAYEYYNRDETSSTFEGKLKEILPEMLASN